MSIVSVLVGQCGNQLGTDTITQIAESASDSSDEAYQHAVSTCFFRRNPSGPTPLARSVQIDMEPKVIEQCVSSVNRQGLFRFGGSCVTREEGSGNNWAFGYFGQGTSRAVAISESIAREIEHCDSLAGIQILHSLAGGTGSGVGCLVSDILRDEYPDATLLHVAVWPFQQGEVMTQWINAALTVSVLNENADGILCLSNDDAAAVTRSPANTQQLPPTRQSPGTRTAYAALNSVLACQTSVFLSPRLQLYDAHPVTAKPSPGRGARWGALRPTDVVSQTALSAQLQDNLLAVVPDVQRKFFRCSLSSDASVSQNSTLGDDSWPSAIGTALRGTASGGNEALLIIRGATATAEGARSVPRGTASLQVQACDVPVRRKAGPVAAAYSASPQLARGFEKCARVVESFLECGAFLHHYSTYGVDQSFIEDAALHCWDIAECYNASL